MLRPPPPPPLPSDFVPLSAMRFKRGRGRRYVPDVVEKVRVLIGGTTWPEAAIAARIGIGVATVHGWKVRRGWRRPLDTSVSTRKVGLARAGSPAAAGRRSVPRRPGVRRGPAPLSPGRARQGRLAPGRDARARDTARITPGLVAAPSAPRACARGDVRGRAARTHRRGRAGFAGSGDRAGRSRPRGAASKQSCAEKMSVRWGEGLVRFSLRPLGGQGRPYGEDVVAQARELVEGTWLTQNEIGARIGVTHMTVCRWARAGGRRAMPARSTRRARASPPCGATPPARDPGACWRRRRRWSQPLRPRAQAPTRWTSTGRSGRSCSSSMLGLCTRRGSGRGAGPDAARPPG